MKQLFPVDVLKQGWAQLVTRQGAILILINAFFAGVFGLGSLISKVLIFGPAILVFQDSVLLFWVIFPVLYMIFFFILFTFGAVTHFVVLFCVSRWETKPLVSFEALKQEKERLGFYLKSAFYTLSQIVAGLLSGIIPGIKYFFNFFFICPLIIFDYQPAVTIQEILNTCGHRMEHRRQEFFYFLTSNILLYVISLLLFGEAVTQLLLVPLLFTYFSLCLVIYYKRSKS